MRAAARSRRRARSRETEGGRSATDYLYWKLNLRSDRRSSSESLEQSNTLWGPKITLELQSVSELRNALKQFVVIVSLEQITTRRKHFSMTSLLMTKSCSSERRRLRCD
ncbi:hypothetical protein JOB18_035697 [Solea senegalensis]|uniref:Uncharacterized protein n=1 Tax=Solea senegalensis TaxID=28829 RepID=A0AAV6R917_SOLSE|nr:hypothetical protein JOB18_035697 [Solea senegalensis]